MSIANAVNKAPKGLNSMLKADTRKVMSTSRFWIMLGISLLMPVLILVMTTMMSGTEVVNTQTGEVTVVEAFSSAWQIIGSEGGADMTSMDLSMMCNINLVYFLAGLFICLLVSDDFTSGYAKNIFTVRAKKDSYVMSKILLGSVAGALMLIVFFLGTVFGGSAAGLPFALGSAGIPGLIMCMLAKIFLMPLFASIAVLVSCFGRQKGWLSVLLFLFAGMLLFMMIPMMTPINAGFMHVIMCLAGGAIFGIALGKTSGLILERQDLA